MRSWTCLILLALMCTLRADDLFPDDHGNSSELATALYGSSNSLSGTLDYPADRDFFTVPLLPQRSLMIQISTGTVWDVMMSWTPPGTYTPLMESNTLWSGDALQSTQQLAGAASTWLLELGAAFEYTTGTYHLAIWMPADEDLDSDGVADIWEQQNFSSLDADLSLDHDGDGLSSLDEYRLQTQPTNALSSLRIDDLQRGQGTDVLSWNASAYASYTLSSADQVDGPWSNLGQVVAGDVPLRLNWTNQASPTNTVFYRLQFHYE